MVDIKLFTVKFFQLCCMFEMVNNKVFVKSLFETWADSLGAEEGSSFQKSYP